MRAVVPLLLILAPALGGCGGQKDDGPERTSAPGEVLGGSVSDAMLPLDTVRSQSPPLRESTSSAERPTGTGPARADEAEAEAPAEPASDEGAPAAEEPAAEDAG